ncbi:MAG: hypothetical protein H0U54_16990 [Acidobacteria bacterium]|nr:hypothetical protein [Acidobacteriota bacterium]
MPLAILLGQPETGLHKFPFLKGEVRLKDERSEPIRSVLIRSAYLFHQSIPEVFELRAAQVFYKDQKIEEVRLATHYPSDPEEIESAEWRKWTTSTPPRFRVRPEGTIILPPEDEGRTHLTAYRRGSSLFCSWDLTANACHSRREEAELFSFDVALSDLSIGEEGDASDTPFEQSKLDEAVRLLGLVPHGNLKNLLLPFLPLDSEVGGDHPLRGKAWAFEFTCDENYARYLLASHFAENIDAADLEINVEEFARLNTISSDEARAHQLINLLARRDEFSREGIPMFVERMRLILSEMTKPLVTLASHMTAHEWGAQRDDLEVKLDDVKGMIQNAVEKIVRKLMKTRGAGRPAGSMTIRTEEEVDRQVEEYLREIFAAMEAIYEKELKNSNEVKAEDAITRKAVAAWMKRDRTTLYNWMKSVGKDFDELKDSFLSKRNTPR